MEIKWNDGMRSRSRTPHLFVRARGEWVRFTGSSIPGALAIVRSSYTKGGKWSSTDYTFFVSTDAVVAEVLQPFEYFGNTWRDHARAITILAGEYDRERAARELMLLVDSDSFRAAIERAEENEAALAAIVQ